MNLLGIIAHRHSLFFFPCLQWRHPHLPCLYPTPSDSINYVQWKCQISAILKALDESTPVPAQFLSFKLLAFIQQNQCPSPSPQKQPRIFVGPSIRSSYHPHQCYLPPFPHQLFHVTCSTAHELWLLVILRKL